ncbi:hypothetical protein C8F01DRAFT_963465, partial [Mycena amicta]
PVLTLPPEILSEIFLHCLLEPDQPVPKLNPERPRAPLLLLQICRTWRNVAIGTPRLWQRLSVCV